MVETSTRFIGFEFDASSVGVMNVFLIILTSLKAKLTDFNFIGDIPTTKRRLMINVWIVTTGPSTFLDLVIIRLIGAMTLKEIAEAKDGLVRESQRKLTCVAYYGHWESDCSYRP